MGDFHRTGYESFEQWAAAAAAKSLRIIAIFKQRLERYIAKNNGVQLKLAETLISTPLGISRAYSMASFLPKAAA